MNSIKAHTNAYSSKREHSYFWCLKSFEINYLQLFIRFYHFFLFSDPNRMRPFHIINLKSNFWGIFKLSACNYSYQVKSLFNLQQIKTLLAVILQDYSQILSQNALPYSWKINHSFLWHILSVQRVDWISNCSIQNI